MSFDALGKMSVGAAAGVVAERGGRRGPRPVAALGHRRDRGGVWFTGDPRQRGPGVVKRRDLPLPDVGRGGDGFRSRGAQGGQGDAPAVPAGRHVCAVRGADALAGRGSAAASRGADGASSDAESTRHGTGFFLAGAGAAAAVYTSGRRRSRRAWTSTTRSLGGRSTRCRSRWTGSCASRARRRASRRRNAAFGAAVGALEASKFSLKIAQTSRRRSSPRSPSPRTSRRRCGGARARCTRRSRRRAWRSRRRTFSGRGGGGAYGGGASQTGVANGGSRDFGVGSRRRARAGERRAPR